MGSLGVGHDWATCIGEGNGNPLQCSCLEIPGTAEPDGLPSTGSHRVGHDWSDLAVIYFMHGINSVYVNPTLPTFLTLEYSKNSFMLVFWTLKK